MRILNGKFKQAPVANIGTQQRTWNADIQR